MPGIDALILPKREQLAGFRQRRVIRVHEPSLINASSNDYMDLARLRLDKAARRRKSRRVGAVGYFEKRCDQR